MLKLSVAQRIYAGTAGGKKYFHGENDKLYDEAGVEQPPKLAAVLKANFPPPPKPKVVPNPTQGRAPPQKPTITVAPAAGASAPSSTPPPVQPTAAAAAAAAPPQPANVNQPQQPAYQANTSSQPGLASKFAIEILRLAFPELYSTAMKYRKIAKKFDGSQKTRLRSDVERKARREKRSADRKRNDKELSLNIEITSSLVRTNGELLRQQLTLQTRSIELLEKISHGVHGHGGGNILEEGGAVAAAVAAVRAWLLPALGVVGAVGTAALALKLSGNNKETNEDTIHNDDIKKYGKDKADELKHFRNESTIDRAKELYNDIPKTDARTPKQRAADQAKKYDSHGVYVGAVPGLANTAPTTAPLTTGTKATAEAEQRKPSGGKVVEIKADSINFEAKTIKLQASTITVNGASSAGGGSGVGQGAQPSTTPPPAPPPISSHIPGMTPTDGDKLPNGEPRSYVSDGRTPAGSVFRPDIATPYSPGGINPRAPGFGGIKGGQGATQFDGGKAYDPRATGTAEAIRKNDLTATQHFQPQPTTGGGALAAGGAPSGKPTAKQTIPDKDTDEAIVSAAKSIGMDPNHFRAMAGIESDMQPDANRNKGTQYKGLFQIGHDEWKDNGRGGDIFNAHDNAMAMARMTKGHIAEFKAKLGRDPTPNELYLVHQQGLGGAIALAKGEKEGLSAVDSLVKYAHLPQAQAEAHIKGNLPPGYKQFGVGISSKNFKGGWGERQQRGYDFYAEKYGAKIATSDQKIPSANAQNTKNMIGGQVGVEDLGSMFGKDSIADQKPWKGDVSTAQQEVNAKPAEAAAAAETKITSAVEGGSDSITKPDPMIAEAMKHRSDKAPPGKFTDELIEKKLDDEAGWKKYLGWKLGPQGRNRRQQLSTDPWASEPGFGKPVDKIPETPSAIPDSSSNETGGGDYHRASQDVAEDPPEKTEGSHTRITDPVHGSKKPKPIRRVDIPKYYPQYSKSDFGDSTPSSGIGVA